MGILNLVKQYAAARLAGKVLGTSIGRNAGAALMLGYVGKKAYDHFRANRAAKLRASRGSAF